MVVSSVVGATSVVGVVGATDALGVTGAVAPVAAVGPVVVTGDVVGLTPDAMGLTGEDPVGPTVTESDPVEGLTAVVSCSSVAELSTLHAHSNNAALIPMWDPRRLRMMLLQYQGRSTCREKTAAPYPRSCCESGTGARLRQRYAKPAQVRTNMPLYPAPRFAILHFRGRTKYGFSPAPASCGERTDGLARLDNDGTALAY